MIKVIDIDSLFDKYIEKYVYSNIGKIKPEEIEDNLPKLYTEFGDVAFDELDGKTPNTYYKSVPLSDLLCLLKTHLLDKISVSDFLCEAILQKNNETGVIVKELYNETVDSAIFSEYMCYLINILNDMNAQIPYNRYLEFVLEGYSEDLSELATEMLCLNADAVKENILNVYNDCSENEKEKLCEILSHCKQDDRVFDILVLEFCKNTDNIPLYSSLLSKYGDEKAIPFLIRAIEDEKINFADFEELRFAIEALGGEYKKTRDFTKDKLYKRIKGEKTKKIL